MGQIVGGSYGARIARPARGHYPEALGNTGEFRPTQSPAALATQNRRFVWAFFEAVSGRPKPEALLGRYVSDPAYRRQLERLEAAFPGFELELEEAVMVGDRLEVRGVFLGIHRGELLGRRPALRSLERHFRVVYRLEGGKIAEHWQGLDLAELRPGGKNLGGQVCR